jgi:N-methylhydantoinase A/oxoprolinase/acetone carboxylase beta subunit
LLVDCSQGFEVAGMPSRGPKCRDFRFNIDRGGTFTDVYAEFVDGEGQIRQTVLKLLSEDPSNYPDAPREGIRRILEQETAIAHPRDQLLDTARITSIRMGTTVSAPATYLPSETFVLGMMEACTD